ncbi:MAG: flagellar hook-length control protein FliK [Thermodesulfobacteriota bacterium]
METFSPQMPPPLDIPGKGFSRRKATPGDVADSLFRNFLGRINEQDDDSGILGLLTKIESPNRLEAKASTGKDQASGIRHLIDKRVTLPAEGLPRLARFLESHGLPGLEIKKLFESLASKNGDIRMDRLLAGLQNLLKEKALAGKNLVIDRPDIPRVKETLFKMGLGAGQVRDVMEKAVNAGGRMSLRSLTSALGAHFFDVRPETGRQLAEVLQREMGISFRAGDMEQAVKDAGLDEAVNRLAGNSPDAVREAAKREIATLMLGKGIPAQEVKQFLESLSIRRAESHAPQNAFWTQNAAAAKNGSQALREDPYIRFQIEKGGTDRQNGSWKERIIDILNRQAFLTGRKAEVGSGIGRGPGPAKSAEVLEDAVSARLQPKQTGINPTKLHIPEGGQTREAIISVDETAKEAAKAAAKGSARANRADDSGTSRHMPTGEISVSRVDRAEPLRQAASAVRGQAAAAALPEPLPKIVDRMVLMVGRGEQASRIQISPPELGRLDLSIVIKQGHLHAHVSAENPVVKEIIEANLPQLKQQLGNLGFTVERFDVSTGLDERGLAEFQARTGGQRNRQGRGGKPAGHGVLGANPDRPHRNPMGELYRIDVRV